MSSTKTAMIQTNKHPACIAWAISMNLLKFVEVYTFSLIIYAVRDVFTLVFPSHTNIAKNGKDKEERGYHHKHRCRSVGTSEQFNHGHDALSQFDRLRFSMRNHIFTHSEKRREHFLGR